MDKNKRIAEITGIANPNGSIPDFEHDPGAAWMLLEHLPGEWFVSFYHVADVWRCDIQVPTDTWSAGIHPETDKIFVGEGENKKLALCRAFLKAVGGEK